ncbi:MAG: signal peptide peptidase SppA [Rhodospirillales bacterium]|nr:signal peptide peptidase SppA [Rhodospirillales bacterium]
MKWRLLPIIWLALKRMAMGLGFLVMLNILVALIVLPAFLPKETAAPSLPDEMVLFLKFEDGLSELPSPVSFADPFSASSKPTVRDIVEALDRARDDARVKGILARMYDGYFDLAKVTEVRAALKRFRESGKFAYIYSSSYGEGGGGLSRYYLASAFEEIWMQPLGIVSIPGVGMEVPFARETLDKLGVQPQFFQRKEYKTAYESLTNKAMSAANREELGAIVNDIRFELLERIPEDRGMSGAAFEKLVNQGLFTAPEAEAAGLITHMDYGDVLLDKVAEMVTGEPDPDALEIVNLAHYGRVMEKKAHGLIPGGKPKVALIYTVGAIMPSGDGGFGDDGIAAADEIAPAILDASKDEKVKAIVLRVDSPGGSPAASESILRAVEKAQERGKPVIVSMGSLAASGGYWVSAYADKIYALPTTLTGSIGVVGGKFSLAGLFDKVGVNWEAISWGKNAGLWSANTPFSASEAERINAMLDNVYDNFIARVAKGRKMDAAAVDKIAKGRVWSGRRALEVGLVDELGGLDDALDYTAMQVGAEDRSGLNVAVYPKPKTPLEQVLELLDTQAQASMRMGRMAALQERALEVFGPALAWMRVQDNPQDYMTYDPLRIE